VPTLTEGVAAAEVAITSGAALEKLEAFAALTQELAQASEEVADQ
jgi:anthranilate phosphoribosyltransferase